MKPTKTIHTAGTCPICENLLGDLPRGLDVHELCAWAQPTDWLALKPWFAGQLPGNVSGT